jgi:hypothetical protein
MFKTILEFMMIGCGILFLVGSIMGIREWFQIRRVSKLSLSQLPVKKSTYCQLVLDWCHENIAQSNTRKPKLRVNYYAHKKWGGLYYSGIHECVIYVNSHGTIKEVTNAVIHEYVHARQKNKNFDKLYEKHEREVGYEMNPFELEAREVAKKHETEALLWACRQIYRA